jgi:hypothetical protein
MRRSELKWDHSDSIVHIWTKTWPYPNPRTECIMNVMKNYLLSVQPDIKKIQWETNLRCRGWDESYDPRKTCFKSYRWQANREEISDHGTLFVPCECQKLWRDTKRTCEIFCREREIDHINAIVKCLQINRKMRRWFGMHKQFTQKLVIFEEFVLWYKRLNRIETSMMKQCCPIFGNISQKLPMILRKYVSDLAKKTCLLFIYQ